MQLYDIFCQLLSLETTNSTSCRILAIYLELKLLLSTSLILAFISRGLVPSAILCSLGSKLQSSTTYYLHVCAGKKITGGMETGRICLYQEPVLMNIATALLQLAIIEDNVYTESRSYRLTASNRNRRSIMAL